MSVGYITYFYLVPYIWHNMFLKDSKQFEVENIYVEFYISISINMLEVYLQK